MRVCVCVCLTHQVQELIAIYTIMSSYCNLLRSGET